jgi:mono/diheme cytochrome c family protein
MRAIIGSLLIVVLAVVLGGAAVIYAGFYDVSATAPHWAVTTWLMETARTRSIRVHAAAIQMPSGLGDPAKVLIGVEHFAAHCAVCHGAPGVPRGDIAEGLYPQPPNLARAATFYTDGELFWIIKHGIKMTGMPAWGNHSDAELWATVAFIKRLPRMSDQDYARLVMANVMKGAMHHPDGTQAIPDIWDGHRSPGRAMPLPTQSRPGPQDAYDHD